MELLSVLHIMLYALAGILIIPTGILFWKDSDDEFLPFSWVSHFLCLILGLGQQFLSDMTFIPSLLWFIFIAAICAVIEMLLAASLDFIKERYERLKFKREERNKEKEATTS
jgi:hypothetical protein